MAEIMSNKHQSKLNSQTFHLGARELEVKNVKLMIPNIVNIKDYIDDFRKNAKMARENHTELKELSYEKYDNFISILGNRGLGKTSIMLTTIKQIKSSEYYCNNFEGKEENKYDLISPLIVPDDMSEISDILGWIIVTLESMYKNQIKRYTTNACLLNRDDDESKLEMAVRKYLNDLKINYHHRKEDYKNIVDKKFSSSNKEYIDHASIIQKQDLEIVNSFNKLIDAMIDYKIYVNKLLNYHDEPLIFFFFDDVDVTAQYCESIFEDFLTFLSNPHIVTFISGDYDLFSQSVTLKMLENEKLDNLDVYEIYSFGKQEKQYQALEMAKNRSEFFLKKVLPPLYRFEIQLLDNRKKSVLTYLDDNDSNELLNKKINELLTVIHGDEDFFLTDFKNESSENIRSNICIFPYYSVFSTNVRGFINVYIYLYRQAKRITNKDRFKPDEVLNFMKEFLEIILNSKNTYRRNLKNISRYLYIKTEKDEVGRDVNDTISEQRNDIKYDKLRIDCEELKEVVEEKIRENYQAIRIENGIEKEYIRDDYREEIEALIMLPLMMNSLQYCFFKDDYKYRYERINSKIKNIFLHIFVKEFNKNMEMFLPDNLDIQKTLLFYSFITTRMSMITISAINGTTSQVRIYNENNDKKYFVQIMKATCDIYCSDVSKEEYNELCYLDNGKNKEYTREEYEEKIIKILIENNKECNYNWLMFLLKMIRNNLSLTSHLYPYDSFYSSYIRESFDMILNIFKKDINMWEELFNILEFLKQLKFVFSDKNIIEFYYENNEIIEKINVFFKSVIERFNGKLGNIKVADSNDENQYFDLLDDFKKDKNNHNINQLADYSFNEQIDICYNAIKKHSENLKDEIYEKIYRDIKKIYDHYFLEISNYNNYDIVDDNDIHNNIMKYLYTHLNIGENNSELEQLIRQQIEHICYKFGIDQELQSKIVELIPKLSKNQDKARETQIYIETNFNELNRLLNGDNSNNNDIVIKQAKALMYLTPMYIVSLYLYDLKSNKNSERGFFLNLLKVFNENLDNEKLNDKEANDKESNNE